MDLNDYPQHAKMDTIPQSDRDAIGSFLEWLSSKGYTICQWRDEGNNGKPAMIPATEEQLDAIANELGHGFIWNRALQRGVTNPEYEFWPEGFYPVRNSIERWLAQFYEIDLDEMNREKQRMYEMLVRRSQ